MALNPHSEPQDLSLPADYQADHQDEHPTDWGWHGEWGKWLPASGWVVVVILLLMMLPAHYNLQGALFLGMTAGLMVIMLMWDRQRRKNAWRK